MKVRKTKAEASSSALGEHDGEMSLIIHLAEGELVRWDWSCALQLATCCEEEVL